MVARSKFLRENLVKQDGSPATDDEFEKLIEEESQIQGPNQSSVVTKQIEGAKTAKSKFSEDPGAKQPKGSKQKKETKDVKISSEAPEQIGETAVVEEVLSNRPPTPPKPKTFLPPLDLTPFSRLIENLIIHFVFIKKKLKLNIYELKEQTMS